MMDNDYSIENLIKRFKLHLEIGKKELEERQRKHKEEYGSDLPKYGPDPEFHISEALLHICIEIEAIKIKLSSL